VSDVMISRQLRKAITSFPGDATPAERLIFKVSSLGVLSSMSDKKLRDYLTPLIREL